MKKHIEIPRWVAPLCAGLGSALLGYVVAGLASAAVAGSTVYFGLWAIELGADLRRMRR